MSNQEPPLQSLDLAQILNRLFKSLAEEHKYTITDDEIGVYIEALSRHGLGKVREAILSILATNEVDRQVFPSVYEFEKVIFNLNKIESRG
jgi:uncharacterized protein YfaA (DUF2138 family)